MQQIIQFIITQGKTHYTATAASFPIVTQAKTLDSLMSNIQEAVDVHFSEEEDYQEFDIGRDPVVFINYELPKKVYA